ncbi:TIGR02679 family protein [Nocardia cyriacigeorgica]|nr:TIGR02679 family protein [Nocardia cyriacigeorgica]MBF6083371.1 TIGR02679 family protein [Nocardia cyriacigeorgica]MBF6088893.1 TIGR02679 family protein [Nocardia cyriacigeorgica]
MTDSIETRSSAAASPDHLRSRLSPALMPLWIALHKRFSSGRPVQRIRIGPLDLEQQTAFADLFGHDRLPGTQASVAVSAIDEALGGIVGCDARTVVAALVGPVSDRSAQRADAAAERNRLWAWLSGHEVVSTQPALAAWAAAMQRQGLVGGSVQRTRTELERALAVLHELPSTGIHLPVFAQQVLRDPHALDEGSRLHTMVVRALAAIYDRPPPTDALGLRRIWALAGISDDELSSTVLVAGSPIIDSDIAVGHILAACRNAGIAAVLTLQQLRRIDRPLRTAERVWVVENPSILATAVARFGDTCPPMVCVSGWPSSAAVVLLGLLSGSGSSMHYNGDFDGEGLRIAANLVARTGVLPWRMSTQDYLAAVGDSGPAVGRVTPVPWDPELSIELDRRGVAVPQERVIDLLLSDIMP